VADQTPASNDLQQKYRQFLDLLPLTLSLAGLPPSEGRLFGEEQIEARGITVRAAFRVRSQGIAWADRKTVAGRVCTTRSILPACAV
jgi:hypothetical protein